MKHQKSIFLAAILLIVSTLGFQAYSVWPQRQANDTSTIPTESIGSEQGVGGVAIDDSPESTEDKSAASTPDQPSSTVTQPTPFEVVAPKQAEIKKQTPIEHEYHALRTSNDPLPQPAWVSSATKMQTAWDTTTGNGAIVAVIDSGFALAHEDLTSQWHQNTGETGTTTLGDRCWTGTSVNKASNNCDDDDNGYTDDWRGWDFVGVNNNPQAGETNPTGQGVAHGTEVAGLVGATGNNGIGTATVSWNNKIMPLQALGDDGSGYTSSVAAAVYYAADNGASVINMSLGGDTSDPTLAQAIRYAYDRGVVVVAAAGNCGTGGEAGCDPTKPGAMGYPALNPYVIAVGATTSTNIRASFSSYGPGLDVTAPGSGSLVSPMWHSSNQTSAYATSLYGTSFASPIVASYVGLLKSLRPTSSVDDITALVDATASKPAGMGTEFYTTQFGHGIIDAQVGLQVAGALNGTSGTPELAQTGSHFSEHSADLNSTMSSGCTISTQAYCTIVMTDMNGYERFLPYTSAQNPGAGWSWRSSALNPGNWWEIRAQSGTQLSTTPYSIFVK